MSTAVVEPTVVSLSTLLEDLGSGKLRVPRFQRAFVWTGDRVVKLLESVRQRYPIGSLLIWRARPGFACFDRVGPHPVEVPSDNPGEVGYLLDGHQRLSSLFGTLVKPEQDLRGPERRPFAIYFDLDLDRFVRGDPKQLWHVPLWELMDAVKVLDRVQAMQPQGEVATIPGTRDQWIKRTQALKQLSSTFQTYRIAINEVKNADLQTAVKVFTLLNSTGQKVSPAEMFGALSWRDDDGFDFAATTRSIQARISTFADLDPTTVLRALLARLGEDIYTTDFEAVMKRHGSGLAEQAAGTEQSISSALELVRTRWGVASIKSLPYALHLVLVSEFLRLAPSRTEAMEAELVRALWLTSYTGAYTVGSAKAFNQAIAIVREYASGKRPDLQALCDGQVRPFPRQFHPKAARVRVFFLFLKALRPRDLVTGEELPWEALLERGLNDAVQVVSSRDEHVRRLANRLLLGRYRGDPRRDLLALYERPDAERRPILESHAISDDALLFLKTGEDDRFIEAREASLMAAEAAFIRDRLGAAATAERSDEPEIDIEDEDEDEI